MQYDTPHNGENATMNFRLEFSISTVRKPNGFRTFYTSLTLFRRLWVQRWDQTGRPNWTWGIAPKEAS
jgi:hypothetical protein